MKVCLILMSVFVAWAVSVSMAAAGGFDPVGDYDFILSESTVSGDCPMGSDGRGRLSIAGEGSGHIMRYLSGMVCRPANVCTLKGSCKNNDCVFSTTVTVDNEGGKVTNSASITFTGKNAVGSGKSIYRHPGGFQCSWTYLLTLTR